MIKQWEYARLTFSTIDNAQFFTSEGAQLVEEVDTYLQALNSLGLDGWEAYNHTQRFVAGVLYHYFELKRRIK